MKTKGKDISEHFFPLMLIAVLATGCRPNQPDAPPGFKIHPDFRMELVASEPLVFDPVELRFDEQGRAFVLEMPGYPLRDEESRLVLLEDTDGDGHYDHRQLFADKLQLASSFMPYRQGMLVAAPPDLLYIRDTDGDKVADDYQVIMSGFSTGNLQHNFNGLHYGLDNWIYSANGGNSGKPYFVADTSISLDMRRNDFRFRIDEKQLESVGRSSGGYGLAFDEWGHLFETHNVRHVSHLVLEDRYLKGLPVEPPHALTVISDHEENGLSRIYPIGEQVTRVNHPEQSGYFSGACGITFYGGNVFPEGFNHNLFVGDVVVNLVHMDVLSADGASFKASRLRQKADFIASSDRAFRPVNMATGPDGALYVLDMHRDVIEHPEWIPDEIEDTLDLSAGKEKGRIYRLVPKAGWKPENFTLEPDNNEQLVEALGHKNQWVRMTAQRLLVNAADQSVIPLLENLIKTSASPLARMHSLWTLEGRKAMKPGILIAALKDPEAGVVENGVKILELHLPENQSLIAEVLPLLEHENLRVRMQAALTISTVSDEQFDTRAVDLITRMGRLLALPEVDQWTTWAVASALKRDPVGYFQQWLGKGTPKAPHLEVGIILAEVAAERRDAQEITGMLNQLDQNPEVSRQYLVSIVDALATGWGSHGQKIRDPKLINALDSLEREAGVPLIRAVGRLRRAIGLPASPKMAALFDQAGSVILNEQLTVADRLERLQLLQLEDFDRRESLLYQLLDNRQPLALQKEALQQLWSSNEGRVGPELVKRWSSLGPEARIEAGDILLRKSFNHDVLLTALEDGVIRVGELNFDLERRRTLLIWSESEIGERAKAFFTDAGVVTRKEAMDKMRPALGLQGHLEKGRELFGIHCGNCHQYGNEGKEVGPPLTEINRKSKASLLHDILDPNAAVDTRFLNHQVKTKDGNIYTGIVERETDSELTLLMMGGQQETIRKSEVESFSSLGLSLMPEGLENAMSEQDMADLLTFLQGGTADGIRPASPEG